MQLRNEIIDDNIIISLTGRIDGKIAAEIQEDILALEKNHSGLLLDMEGVTYLSSAGLRILLAVYRQAKIDQKKIALLKLTPEVKQNMDITGFLDHFVVFDDKESGLQWLNS